jgi:hypothetical protein
MQIVAGDFNRDGVVDVALATTLLPVTSHNTSATTTAVFDDVTVDVPF